MFFGHTIPAIIIASLFTLWSYYQQEKSYSNFAPGPYEWQWQKAMSWVRANTPESAVFAHWWDYGYWLQSIGERATILDGAVIHLLLDGIQHTFVSHTSYAFIWPEQYYLILIPTIILFCLIFLWRKKNAHKQTIS